MLAWNAESYVSLFILLQPGHLFAPLWQVSPADYGAVNVNLLSDPRIAELYEAMLAARMGVLSSNFQVGDLVRHRKHSICCLQR